MKHLLRMKDLNKDELYSILDLGVRLKKELQCGENKTYLNKKSLGMIFQKSSTRTRVSFEVGMYQLGGKALYLNSSDLQMGRGEPIQDTARVLSRYLDIVMIRTYAQKDVEDLAHFGTIPVINGLTDYAHPCQVLADLMTVREIKGGLEGLKLCYIGDGNNMCNSLIVGALTAGMEVSVAALKDYMPAEDVTAWAKEQKGFSIGSDPSEAIRNADVVITDVWASMGNEKEAQERKKAFSGSFQINKDLMRLAKKDAMVQHCLPAHRGEEITEEVFEAHASEIFEEAENRLHVQKAVILKLLGKG